eukprot:jgi/Ulvmu1/4261/UM194_0001.1
MASSSALLMRRALRSDAAQPDPAVPEPPAATDTPVEPSQPGTGTGTFPFPPIHIMQTSQVNPDPAPVPGSTSQSNISWPVVIGITIAAMLCLCGLLVLIYMRANQRLKASRTVLPRLKSPNRNTKWITSSRRHFPDMAAPVDPIPSAAAPPAAGEPTLLVQKWLETLTPLGADDGSGTGDVPALPPTSPDASPVSPVVPQEALLASRSDDKLQHSSQMHNNPIYDIRPPVNDNPVFVVDVSARGSRSIHKASVSSSEVLQMTHVTPPRYTPCSSPGASVALQQLSPAWRVGASSGVDRCTTETLDLDHRRSSRSKPLWALDSATRMPVKGSTDDTSSLLLAHDPVTDELTGKLTGKTGRTSWLSRAPTKGTGVGTPQGRHLYRHTDDHSPSHPLHLLPTQKEANPVAPTVSSLSSAVDISGSDASISPSSSHPWEMYAPSDSGTWPPPDLDDQPPDAAAAAVSACKLSAERLIAHNRTMPPLLRTPRGTALTAAGGPPAAAAAAGAAPAAAAAAGGTAAVSATPPEAAAATAAAAVGAAAAAAKPPSNVAATAMPLKAAGSITQSLHLASVSKQPDAASPVPLLPTPKPKPSPTLPSGKPKPVWNPSGSPAAHFTSPAPIPGRSRRRNRTASAPPGPPAATDDEPPKKCAAPEASAEPSHHASGTTLPAAALAVVVPRPDSIAARTAGGRSTKVLTRTHRAAASASGRSRSFTPSAATLAPRTPSSTSPTKACREPSPRKASFSGSREEYSRLTHSQRVSTRHGLFDRAAAALRGSEPTGGRAAKFSGSPRRVREEDSSGLVWESGDVLHRRGSTLHDRRKSSRLRRGSSVSVTLTDSNDVADVLIMPQARDQSAGSGEAHESGKPLPQTVRERIRRAAESRLAARSARAYANGAAAGSVRGRVPEITVVPPAADVDERDSAAEAAEPVADALAGKCAAEPDAESDVSRRTGREIHGRGSGKRALSAHAWTRCIRPHGVPYSNVGSSGETVSDAVSRNPAFTMAEGSRPDPGQLIARSAGQEGSVGGGARALAAEQAKVASSAPKVPNQAT